MVIGQANIYTCGYQPARGTSTPDQSVMGPLGCRYSVENDFFNVVVYSTPVELVGGAGDGVDVDFNRSVVQCAALLPAMLNPALLSCPFDANSWARYGKS